METHKYSNDSASLRYIFMLTDCNRQDFQLGISENLHQISEICETLKMRRLLQTGKAYRLVYYEQVHQGYAFQRYRQLQQFTISQKARLICSKNRNWKDLLFTSDLRFEPGLGKEQASGPGPECLPARCEV